MLKGIPFAIGVVLLLLATIWLSNYYDNTARFSTGPCGSGPIYQENFRSGYFWGEKVKSKPNLSLYEEVEKGRVFMKAPINHPKGLPVIPEPSEILVRSKETCDEWVKETRIDFRPRDRTSLQ